MSIDGNDSREHSRRVADLRSLIADQNALGEHIQFLTDTLLELMPRRSALSSLGLRLESAALGERIDQIIEHAATLRVRARGSGFVELARTSESLRVQALLLRARLDSGGAA
jgi:hypothetical protein